MERGIDFPERFGNYPSQCSPSVSDWNFKNPPIELSDRKLIHVVHVPKSWNGPHGLKKNEGYCFMKRTNKGNEPMSYDEVRSSFLGYYEKRMKLNLLAAEIENIKKDAESIQRRRYDSHEHFPNKFETSILQTILSDVFVILADRTDLLTDLNSIRSSCRAINEKITMINNVIHMPLSDINQRIERHNGNCANICDGLTSKCDAAIITLREITKK